jgi:hypothetical protein
MKHDQSSSTIEAKLQSGASRRGTQLQHGNIANTDTDVPWLIDFRTE